MERCSNCGIPEGKFHVVLNDKGICNYCEYFEQNKQALLDFTNREQLLERRFQKFKGKYQYDAAVGLSGGKDSTYVLYQMVKKYGLNVAAVTLDNGFLTDFARESIKNTVENLGVYHLFYKPDWNTHKKYYKAAVQKLGNPCVACAIAGYFLSIKACYENKIPFFVHGRTPFQMYRNFYPNNNDVFLYLMKLNLTEHSFSALAKTYGMVNEYVKQSVFKIADNAQDAKEITDEFFIDSSKLTEEFVPEFLAYFLFEEYDEQKVKQRLEDVLNWKRPASDNLLGHYDCAIHDASSYLYKELHDINQLEPDIAVMRRFGAISKEKADELIKFNEPAEISTEKSLDSLCALCGFGREDLDKNLAALKQAGIGKFESL